MPTNEVKNEVKVVKVPVGQLRPNTYNPNRQNVQSFDLLVKSIQADGFTLPVIVNSGETCPHLKDVIIDGEHRWRAALVLSMTHVPVIYKDMDEGQMRTATIRHNKARGHHDALLEAHVLKELVGEVDPGELAEALNLDKVELDVMLQRANDYTDLSDLAALNEDVVMEELGNQGLEGEEARVVAHRHAMIDSKKTLGEQDRQTLASEDGHNVRVELIYSGEQAEFIRRLVASYGSAHDAIIGVIGE